MGLVDVSQQVTWLDEVVAGVEVAVVLERRAVAAGRCVDAQQVAAEIGLERHVEQLHVDLTDVVPDPLLEDVDEKAPYCFRPTERSVTRSPVCV